MKTLTWPTFDEVQLRHLRRDLRRVRGLRGGGFAPYSYCVHDEQPWPCDAIRLAVEREQRNGTVIHRCPIGDSGYTLCCDKSPFVLPRIDRLTEDKVLVTCHGEKGIAAP